MTVADTEQNPEVLEVQLPNIHSALSTEVAQPDVVPSNVAAPNPTQQLYKSMAWWKDADVEKLVKANIPLIQ